MNGVSCCIQLARPTMLSTEQRMTVVCLFLARLLSTMSLEKEAALYKAVSLLLLLVGTYALPRSNVPFRFRIPAVRH